MKKKTVLAMILEMTVVLAACGTEAQAPATEPTEVAEAAAPTEEAPAENAEATEAAEPTEAVAEAEPTEAEAPAEEADIMSHADYIAAAVDDAVTVDVYVQATQSWWEDKITVYAADEDGAYFIYNMACSEEDSEKLTQGAHILVNGFKGEWSGEVEIVDATFEFLDGTYVVDKAEDVTALLGKDELIDHQNEFVAFTDLEVAAKQDADGKDVAFLYNWDGSGEPGSDLYFDVQDADGNVYTFTVESYLCGQDTDVYKAVEGLNIGDKVDLEGFLYWYEGVNPHITAVTVK
ncbi:MAG: hypothetical protein IKO10_07905 [Lachnospiraceae bacterium]|nr:hypothetical protein [Lachnospiraceae bacterium]